ncbi:hypothetical protein ACQ4PT_028387 [Festuca glaucescens]
MIHSKCIAKEAVFASELLRRGAKGTDDEIEACNFIRQCALSLMDIRGLASATSVAVASMVGVAKEAKLMCEWMREADELYVYSSYHPFHKVGNRRCIRISTLEVIEYVLEKFPGDGDPFMMMDFGKKVKNMRRMAKVGTSNKDASQIRFRFLVHN